MATSVRSAAAPRRLSPSIPPASAGHVRVLGRFGARTGPHGVRGLSMVLAASTRRRAKEGDGVLGAPVLGGPGAELGDQLSVVMKFGGSSVSSAARMEEVAGLILTFPEERPVIVLSAMGKTTNNLLLAGEKAVGCGVIHVSEIEEWNSIRDLHIRTVDELGLPRSVIHCMLDELEQLLKGIAMMKELTLRTRDYLVSFGECMSTRIFAAYLNKIGVKARQYDAFDIGFITTDDFGNGDILEATYPVVAKKLHGDWVQDPAIPVVTGFLGKGWKSGAVTTLGRGGSDLTATTIGKALGLREIQVWKDVDGVLTCDPNIYTHAKTVPHLTFEEATELAYFGAQVLHPQSMRPAREGEIPVRVKNSYNPKAPGTLITKQREMDKVVLTSIVLKSNVTMLDIVSTRMLGQFGFLARVFAIFEDLGISVDCVATSEVSVSVSLDPSKIWSRELIQQMASSEQSGERTVLGDLTNSIIINGSPVPSSSQATPVDPKELRRQKDREKYAQMDINKKEEFLKKRREARQKRKVGVARVNQNQHSTCMVQDNEDNTEQEVPTNDVGTKHRNVDGPCTDHEGAKRKQNKATSSTYSKEKKSQQDRERYAKMDENKKN